MIAVFFLVFVSVMLHALSTPTLSHDIEIVRPLYARFARALFLTYRGYSSKSQRQTCHLTDAVTCNGEVATDEEAQA